MRISEAMDDALFVLALAAVRTPDAALRAQIDAAQQRFDELRLAVAHLEERCGRPPAPGGLPHGWQAQRGVTAQDTQDGRIVSLRAARAGRTT